jgi:hypothetical protein
MRLDRAERQSGDVRGVSVAMAERKTEHGASPAFRRQRIHGALNIKAGAVVRRLSLRRPVIKRIQIPTTGFAAVMVKKAAIGDAQQPTADILYIGQAVGDPERLEKRFLRQLISEGTIPTEPAQEGSDRALMGADNQLKCVEL